MTYKNGYGKKIISVDDAVGGLSRIFVESPPTDIKKRLEGISLLTVFLLE